MADEPLTICPECNGAIRRILFASGIVFKGSGFYKTDHGNGAVIAENNNNNKAETKEGKEGAAKTESASETKTSSGEKAATPAPTGDSKVSAAAD